MLDFSRDADGRLFLVMEYVHGRDLAALFATGPLPAPVVIYVIAELLRGLAYAHDLPDPGGSGRGLVHRDVTPRNVLLSYEGEVKVADFGLARMRDASGKVRSDVVRGTPSYMSPEQCRGLPLDGRSDLCAVGAILWELLAHRPMYSGTPHEVVSQVLFKELERPGAVARARVPPDLEAIAMKLLARDRDERYPTAQAALGDLMRCADAPKDGRGEFARLLAGRFPDPAARAHSAAAATAAERRRVAAQLTAAAPPSTLASAASQTAAARSSRLRRGMLAGLGVLLLAVLIAGAFVAGRGRSRDATVAPRADAAAALAAADAAAPRPPAADAAVPIDASVVPRPAPAPVPAASQPAPPPPPIKQAPGELVVLVRPWATLILDGKQVGETPYRASLPAGRHSLQLANEERGKTERTTITITPGRTTTIERNW